MAEQVAPPAEKQELSGGGTPLTVSAEEYLEHYAHDHYEWVAGELIEMTPVSLIHDALVFYLRQLIATYFTFRPIGRVVGEPVVQRLESIKSYRQPDLQVILDTNLGQLTATGMIGPADVCIEVVSPESEERNYGKKFIEYEKGGVKEYWLFDPIREVALFRRLNEKGLYEIVETDDGYYSTPLLPGLKLHVPTLWAEKLPDVLSIVEQVKAMPA